MISEAMGKILGMVMAYGVSALGLLLAYVNYRKRIVKAERVMSGTAWGVVAAIFVVIALGVWIVAGLTPQPAPAPPAVGEAAVAEAVIEEETPAIPPQPEPVQQWSWMGLILPLLIFAFATWVTAALYRHFSTQHHASGP